MEATKGRVLIMDDEEIVRTVVGKMLEYLGYRVAHAREGGEAVQAYRQALDAGAPFDAVIMDLTIPSGMGGEEAVKALLALDPGAKAVVSSGYSEDPIMADYRKYGFSAVIGKPYELRELDRVLSSLVGRGQGSGAR